MENKKVIVKNMINSVVGLNLPDLRLTRTWERKGVKKTIDLDVLREAMYDPGTEYMFRNKILYIDDKDVRIELGLEDPESKTDFLLDEKQMKRYLTVLPVKELKEALPKMGEGQVEALIDYAVKNEIVNFDRCQAIKDFCGKDIINIIQLNRKDEGNNDSIIKSL